MINKYFDRNENVRKNLVKVVFQRYPARPEIEFDTLGCSQFVLFLNNITQIQIKCFTQGDIQ